MRQLSRLVLGLVLASALSACGGGGGSSAPSKPGISITSPTDGSRITGPRSITVTGTVSSSTTVTVSTNGGTAVAASVSNGSFTAALTLDPQKNAIVATATGTAGSAQATANVLYPFLSLATFESAKVVIGQADFTSTATTTISGDIYGNAGWDGTNLYLSDYSDGQIYVFAGLPTANGAAPAFALTTVNGGTPSSSFLKGPETVEASGGKLFVADYDDDRVVIVDALPSKDGASASVVLGQASLTAQASGCGPSLLYEPESLFVTGTKLIVADSGNNRVLVWNTIPTSIGQAPDLVLGQSDLGACTPNAGGISASSLDYPSDVYSDGTMLLVVDQNNNRVLGWKSFPTANGAAADFVLGQADFASSGSGTTQASLDTPYFVSSNGNQLFVTDASNNRVLVWNTLPSATGALPDAVLGQGDFTHGTSNDADQDGTADATPSANTLSFPSGVRALDDGLVVSDGRNFRYLVFR